MKDIRIDQTRKIVESVLMSKSLGSVTQVMVSNDNNVVCVVDNTLLYVVPLKNLDSLPSIAFMYNDIIDLEVDEYIPDFHLLSILSSLYMNYMNEISIKPLVASNPELRGNEQFESLISMKAAEGMKYFNLIGKDLKTNYKIPIFSGFPNLSKPDLIGINVYDQLDGHLIIEMNIFKKKINRDFKMYFRTLKITGEPYACIKN